MNISSTKLGNPGNTLLLLLLLWGTFFWPIAVFNVIPPSFIFLYPLTHNTVLKQHTLFPVNSAKQVMH